MAAKIWFLNKSPFFSETAFYVLIALGNCNFVWWKYSIIWRDFSPPAWKIKKRNNMSFFQTRSSFPCGTCGVIGKKEWYQL